jgi:hypothetical protein
VYTRRPLRVADPPKENLRAEYRNEAGGAARTAAFRGALAMRPVRHIETRGIGSPVYMSAFGRRLRRIGNATGGGALFSVMPVSPRYAPMVPTNGS